MYVRSPTAKRASVISDVEDAYGASVKKSVTTDNGDMMSMNSSQKQIFWTTTNKMNFADAGPLDKDNIVESRRSAQHLSMILRKALQKDEKVNERETRTMTMTTSPAHIQTAQTVTPKEGGKGSLVKTPSVPLVHGNSDFHLMRYKQRAFSNYGRAKKTTNMANIMFTSGDNLEVLSADDK